jgi:hypothetical protein
MGSGVACFDFDHDGWTDLFLGQGCPWHGKFFCHDKKPDLLLRNCRGRFRAVEQSSELSVAYYTTGIAAGDSNNDGFFDLFVTALGQSLLFVNNGDGTFQPGATMVEQIDSYGASCTWTDCNKDGVPDIFVTRYVRVSEADYPVCRDDSYGIDIACPPWKYEAVSDSIIRGIGDGSFSDCSKSAGLRAVKAEPGLGVATFDVDDDDDLDIFVANDSAPNHLWINDGQGHFTEDGMLAGVALNGSGSREAGMGVAVGDTTADGRPDLVITNYFDESNTFYRNEGSGFFQDITDGIGIGAPSRSKLGFGINLSDFDGDSDLDLFVANGHIHDRLKDLGRDIPYAQSAQVLVSENGRFIDRSALSGDVFGRDFVGRSSATFDFNGDFQTDVVMTTLNGPPVLLRNSATRHGNVLKLHLVGRRCMRNPIGAKVVATISDSLSLTRFVDGGTSYLSTSESTVTFGVSEADRVVRLTVQWPGGQLEEWKDFEAGHEWVLVEGVTQAFQVPSEL